MPTVAVTITTVIVPLHVSDSVYRCRNEGLSMAVPLPLPFLIIQE